MIVPMKHLSLVCLAPDSAATLEKLRDFGCAHIKLADTPSETSRKAKEGYEEACAALRIIDAVSGGAPLPSVKVSPSLDPSLPESETPAFDLADPVASVNALSARDAAFAAMSLRLESLLDDYRCFGALDPECIEELESKGFKVLLLKAPAGALSSLEKALAAAKLADPDAIVKHCGSNGKSVFGAIVTTAAEAAEKISVPGVERMPKPELSVGRMDRLSGLVASRRREISAELGKAAENREEITKIAARLCEKAEFERVADAVGRDESLAWISGWVPAPQAEALTKLAKENSWAVLLRDPKEDEYPPVMLQPPRCFKPVVALFGGLGIVPAYREADISVPFFCFFSIFFAMLVGDGAYGLIILACTLAARKKLKTSAPKGWYALLLCFSLSTVLWGVLSNTWFGWAPKALDNPVSEWLADPTYRNMMLLCFTLGLAHLAIARIWNFICLLPDSLAIAELGWTGTLISMYCITCSIVGIFPAMPSWTMPLLAVSAVLLFVFSVKPKDLKKEGIALGMLPLNIVSTLGDIISYVRLFAVGLASVKVAQNFNDMALQLDLPVWLKILPMMLILIIGHGLNLLMAALSVLVHAVRLNTLEFSNHKGISWSGTEFRPFRKMP